MRCTTLPDRQTRCLATKSRVCVLFVSPRQINAGAAGLLVVSTAVGGVPEVLPPDMLLLADPSPEGLVAAVGRALQVSLWAAWWRP